MVLPKNREKAKGTEFWANVSVDKRGYARAQIPPHVLRNEELRSLEKKKHRIKFRVIEKEKK